MTSYVERAVRFIWRNAFRNTEYFIQYALNFYNPEQKIHPRYMKEDELEAALESGKSLIRMGDGEIYMINFGSIHYQKYDAQLRSYFIRLIQEYTEESLYLIGIPEQYLGMSNTELKKENKFYCWLPFKITFRKLFNAQATYFDAHLFYRGKSFERILEKVLIGKKVLLITSSENWTLMQEAKIEEKLSIEYVECKAQNSFDDFDTLLEKIVQKVGTHASEYRILASAGPASKALVYELSKKGIVGYDLGRGIEAVYRPNTIEGII